ncbi:MAG: hypothetical protein NVSMB23_15400 [Myxococcales bacterium]
MGGATYNAWRLTALTELPGWALALAALALAGAVALSARGLRGEPSRGRRGVLLTLRTLAAVLLFALLLEPGLELRAESRVRARVALLIDTSRSMRFPARADGGGSRIEETLRWLRAKSTDLQELAGRFQVDVYGFDKELSPQDPQKLAAALDAKGPGQGVAQAAAQLANGPATDLLGALGAASQAGTAGRPLAGVVVASDGADNVELSQGLTASAREALGKLGAPVFALPAGAGAAKDLAVERVAVDDFAFVRNQATVEVTLTARGFPSTDVPVTLKREGQLLAQASVRLGGDVTRAQVKLTFVPDHTGKFAFTVAAPVYEGEALAQNNARSFVLKVIRDRVRVLLVVGRPSWDVRFLRQLLKKDANVDLISFFILRTPGDDPHSSQEELSLIPFPTAEIFQEQLKSFDLVVFQDFGNRPWYRLAQYLEGVAAYVREGGAFAMIGGEQTFSAGEYGGTPIEDILPVALLPQGAPAVDEAQVQPQLTEAGKRHPITELLPGAAANQALWGKLPLLPGVNLVGPPRPNAQTLLAGPDQKPVLVIGEAGQGRTLALLSDSSWQWSFLAAGQELGPRAYETFWHNAIRWLVRDPALTPMRLAAERPSFEPGVPASLDAQVRGSDYGAAGGSQLSLSIVSGADGSARLALPPLSPGAYKVVASARAPNGQPIGVAEEAFTVAPAGPEELEAAPRPDLLAAVAQATSGRLIGPDDRLASLPWRDPERVEVGQRTSRPLWDKWAVLALLCCIVGAEWTLRRRWGYA